MAVVTIYTANQWNLLSYFFNSFFLLFNCVFNVTPPHSYASVPSIQLRFVPTHATPKFIFQQRQTATKNAHIPHLSHTYTPARFSLSVFALWIFSLSVSSSSSSNACVVFWFEHTAWREREAASGTTVEIGFSSSPFMPLTHVKGLVRYDGIVCVAWEQGHKGNNKQRPTTG